MARTKKAIRGYIDRIIYLRRVAQPKILGEIAKLGAKLGLGNHRSSEHPGIIIRIGKSQSYSSGWRHDWKAIIKDISKTRKIPIRQLELILMRHRTRTHSFGSEGLSVSVCKDTAKNPKKAAA